jgi:D-aminopeptidase
MRFHAAAVNRHTTQVAVLVNGLPEAVELTSGADKHLTLTRTPGDSW